MVVAVKDYTYNVYLKMLQKYYWIKYIIKAYIPEKPHFLIHVASHFI
jgi:hypothetical protein